MTLNIEALQAPFPRELIKQREGGRGKMLDYLEGHTVIRRLNESAGEWSFKVKDQSGESLTVMRKGAEAQVLLLKVLVELEIPGMGTRQHVGVQLVEDNSGEDMHKGAITDALKKAATLFGVGLDLYEDAAHPAQGSTQARTPRPQQPASAPPPVPPTREPSDGHKCDYCGKAITPGRATICRQKDPDGKLSCLSCQQGLEGKPNA